MVLPAVSNKKSGLSSHIWYHFTAWLQLDHMNLKFNGCILYKDEASNQHQCQAENAMISFDT